MEEGREGGLIGSEGGQKMKMKWRRMRGEKPWDERRRRGIKRQKRGNKM
jgi:hypothetical protein